MFKRHFHLHPALHFQGIAPPKAQAVDRYFFNDTSKECQKFRFAGRLTRGNNFESEAVCHQVCLATLNLHPVSVKINRMSTSLELLASQLQKAEETPVLQFGRNFTSTFIALFTNYSYFPGVADGTGESAPQHHCRRPCH
ncbi:unnamed protein product [Dibothriocephalus latus]|uniref:BPTI/Kunitz inhibitor domain-containing protein n=1 Tax=Dibothriocephalus latus TaxID=60516 RepID=A0A3P6SAZ0_DIBLA|nr:unnamed protein product [Dibothriocephalus latus]